MSTAWNNMIQKYNRKVMFVGTEKILRIVNREWDTYDYYWKNECFMSAPRKDSALITDKKAIKMFNEMQKLK